jgi:S-layer protein (TIGR01567 family)
MSKRITAVALAVLMLALALPASAQIQASSVEIRGTVYDAGTTPNPGSFHGGNATWTPQTFAGFYYDSKENLGAETLNALGIDDSGRKIVKNNLTYTTAAQPKMLKVVSEQFNSSGTDAAAAGLDRTGSGQAFFGGNYYIMGWQAQPYVALNSKVDKLAPLIIEQGTAASEKKTLQVGETWDVGGGWTLTANSIDAKATPRQVWLTLSKDGVKKDDKVLSSGAGNAKPIYTYTEKSIAGETDVPLFVTYVDSVFAGATSDMVQLRYTWAVSTSVTQVKSSDTYGIFKDAAIDQNAKTLSLKNTDTDVSLTQDSTQDLMGKMQFRVADNSTLRFYPIATYTDPGTYEVRGTVYDTGATNGSFHGGKAAWTAQTFAGFYYDSKDNLGAENLNAIAVDDTNRKIVKNNLWYNTSAQPKMLKVVSEQFNSNAANAAAGGLDRTGSGQAFEGGNYYIIGWQAQPYVALNSKVDKLAQLIIEQGTAASEKKTLTVGENWDVGGGWTLTANSIDAKATPRQVWLTLSKDGVKKDDKVLSSGGANAKPIYTYTEKSIAGETDVPLFVTYVDSVFAGATSDMVQLRYTWAVSTSVTQVKSSDTYGIFKDAAIDQNAKTLSLKNTDTDVSLTQDSTQDLMGNMKFLVADNATLRFYPKVDYEITGENVTATATAGAPGATATGTPTNVTNVTGVPTGAATIGATTAGTTVETAAVATPTPTPRASGFEAGVAIAGLLAVAFLVLRQRK